MRILLIGPTGGAGSIPPYLAVLTAALRHHGARVDRVGTPGVPYDVHTGSFWPAEHILTAAAGLLDGVDLGSYDLISLHYGNLEVEQLIPMLLQHRTLRPPVVHHVHSLDWSLFTTHVPDLQLRGAVDQAIGQMDGLLFFGDYARARLASAYPSAVPTAVAWLPTTIPPGTRPGSHPDLRAALLPIGPPLASLYGYAAPWKDAATLVQACQRTSSPCRVLLAGPFWNDPAQAGTDLSRTTASVDRAGARLDVLARYLGPRDRKALTMRSKFAIFPYKHQPTFQGSGAIADYLAHGVPVLGTRVANMAELVADAGIIVEPQDADALADGIDRLAGDTTLRRHLAARCRRRATLFSPTRHAKQCLRLYEAAIRHRAGTRTGSRSA